MNVLPLPFQNLIMTFVLFSVLDTLGASIGEFGILFMGHSERPNAHLQSLFYPEGFGSPSNLFLKSLSPLLPPCVLQTNEILFQYITYHSHKTSRTPTAAQYMLNCGHTIQHSLIQHY
jgi:hypothetical protein